MDKVQALLRAAEPPKWAVVIVAAVLLISGCGTLYFWTSMYTGREYCVDCVPFGLSTYRFLHWPLSDFFLDLLCFSTAFGLLRKSKFVYLSGVTLAVDFIFMAVLAVYTDLTSGKQTQPMFLNVWFVGWGSFLLWFMHYWRSHWTSSSDEALPTQRRTGAI